jgi:hypothetical protein
VKFAMSFESAGLRQMFSEDYCRRYAAFKNTQYGTRFRDGYRPQQLSSDVGKS